MSELNIFGLREYSRQDLFVDATDAIREADRFYIMTEADVVLKDQEELIAKKDKEIAELKRSLIIARHAVANARGKTSNKNRVKLKKAFIEDEKFKEAK